MKIEALKRTFAYNVIQLADPGAALTPAEVKDFYCAVYPDLTNAEIEGPKVDGNIHAYTFRRAVGTKGAVAMLYVKEYFVSDEDEGIYHADNPQSFDATVALLIKLREAEPNKMINMFAEIDA